MKALVISDDKDVLDVLETYLKKQNIDSITYSWFLKALDNIEEIKPDFLFINGEEYPRHWKILSQFLKSNIIGKQIPVFVYSAMDLNEDEENKIKALKNTILLNSLKDELLNKLTEKYDLSEIEEETVSAIDDSFTSVEEIISEENNEDISAAENLIENKQIIMRALINSNVNKKIIIGKLIFNSFEDMRLKFIPDYSEDLDLFTEDSTIHDAFYEYQKDCIHFNAKVLNVLKDTENSVELEFLE